MGMMTAMAMVAALLRPLELPLDPDALSADCVDELLAEVRVDVCVPPGGVNVMTG